MSLVASKSYPIKPAFTRVSWGLLAASCGLSVVICCICSYEPTESMALFSLAVLTFLSLWRPELALAAFVNGIALVGHTWASIGLQGLGSAVGFSVVLLALAVYCVRYRPRLRWGLLPAVVLLFGVMIMIGLLHTPAPELGLRRAAEYLMINLCMFGVILLNHDSRVLWRFL